MDQSRVRQLLALDYNTRLLLEGGNGRISYGSGVLA